MKNPTQKKLAAVFFVLTFLFSVSRAFADMPPNAGSEEKKFKEEGSFLKETPTAKAEPKVIEKKEEPAPAPAPSGPADTITFRIREVRFTGNESIDNAELQGLVASILNVDIHLSDVQDAITAVKHAYRAKGLVATYVYLPQQDVKSGILQIGIIEGRLGKLEITGNEHFSTELLESQFHIKSGDVVGYDNFKKDLVRLQKHPDIDVKAVLKPGAAKGTTDIEVQTKDRDPLHVGVDANNLGTRDTGRYRFGVSASHDNLLGRMDQLSGRYQVGERTWAAGGDYNIPVNDEGTRLGFDYSHAKIDVGGPFSVLGVEGESSTYSPYIIHPVYETEDWNITLRGAVDWKEVEDRVLSQVSGKDDLFIPNLGLNVEEKDEWGKTFSPHSFNVGVADILGASHKNDPHAIRTGTGGQFFAYRGGILRYQQLPWELTLALKGNIQLTNDRLPSSEQLRLGGAQSIRGYQEGEYMADNGGYVNVELYAPIYPIPTEWQLPYSKESLRQQIQMVGFVDIGGGELKKPLVGEKHQRTMAGVGAGLRMHLFDKFYGRAELGFPVGGDQPVDGRSSAFYFGVSYEIL